MRFSTLVSLAWPAPVAVVSTAAARAFALLLAVFVGLAVPNTARAQGPAIDDVEVVFSARPTGAASAATVRFAGPGARDAPYTGYTQLGSSNPATPTPGLGSFSIDAGNSSSLSFTGASVVAEPFTDRGVTATPTAARVFYRVFLAGTPVGSRPAFSLLTLGNARPFPAFPVATLYDATISVNLLSGLLGGGTYVVEASFEATYSNGSIKQATGNTYTANFTVTTPAGGTSTWISASSTDWLLAANWSNGVPTSASDATIPDKSPDPAISTATPVLNSQDSTRYNVRSLTLDGGTTAGRTLLRIGSTAGGPSGGATLNVYGNLTLVNSVISAASADAAGGSRKARNATIVLRGGNQKIKGTLTVADLVVSGTGTKAIVNEIAVNNTLVFDPNDMFAGALLETVEERADGTVVFNATGVSKLRLNGEIVSLLSPNSSETNESYVRGVTVATRTMFRSIVIDGVPTSQLNRANTFGNVGLEIIPRTLSSDPVVTITRTVGAPLLDPIFPGRQPKPLKRHYNVSGAINNAPNVSDIIVHYLDSPDELNDNLDETQLVLFSSANNTGPPYGFVGGTANPIANTVRKNRITAINTITLGSRNNPLPVTLTAFDAQRVNDRALLTWQTASEQNCRGYRVEVSTDGVGYRPLGFVPSAAPTSVQVLRYSYSDAEPAKQGVRYYRLAQLDLDGQTTYYGPRTVSFDGPATGAPMVAYPNPFTNADQLRATVWSPAAGSGQLLVADLTGRLLSQQPVALAAGSNHLLVAQAQDLNAGVYVVRLVLPSGQAQHLKVLKQ